MRKLLPILLLLVMLTPFVVAAQTNPCTGGTQGNIGQCISRVYIWSLGASGLLAVTMAVFGGYLVMSARGNGQQAARGKSFIISSLIGMLLLAGAYLLLNTINPDLTDFNLPSLESTRNPNTTQPRP